MRKWVLSILKAAKLFLNKFIDEPTNLTLVIKNTFLILPASVVKILSGFNQPMTVKININFISKSFSIIDDHSQVSEAQLNTFYT